ncbi:glycosyl transferase [Rhizobium sp. GN54]|uniref:glycosyl transferase n=1 Tax=Rhizobium sp. GN54 TaxID=2898150 RepID=UPI001E4E4CD7|nr:glycosyl transferase [Rhizobium sp. GN54]MCD2184386.1 glycosyl transferase [Rhizobium sp. GN54]
MAGSDRPFTRSLVKLGTRLLLGRNLAHVQDWFPGLSIDERRMLHYRRQPVATLRDIGILIDGQREWVHIVGSGPSVAGADLSRLAPASAILLNGAIHLACGPVAAPLAVAVEDERFVYRHFDLMRDKIAAGQACLFSVAVLRAICEHDRGWLSDKGVILVNDIRKPYGLPRRTLAQIRALDFVRLDPSGDCGFSLQPGRGVFQGGSVVVSALQFAVALRPEKVGFAGIDIRNATEPRFYEERGRAAFSGIAGAEARILGHVALARDVAGEQGISFVNFSPVSALADIGIAFDDRLVR